MLNAPNMTSGRTDEVLIQFQTFMSSLQTGQGPFCVR
jgi:hypothetical protein